MWRAFLAWRNRPTPLYKASEHAVDIHDNMELTRLTGETAPSDAPIVVTRHQESLLVRGVSLFLLLVEYVVYPVVTCLVGCFVTHTWYDFMWTVVPLGVVWTFLRQQVRVLWHRRAAMLAICLVLAGFTGYAFVHYMLVPDVRNKVRGNSHSGRSATPLL